jgi:serine phosphatase RsbU (regulator of sigma subunit)/putative methionine-R-sulfoxide reductase with GAF domain
LGRFFVACVCFSTEPEVLTAVESRTPALTALSAGADRLASGADAADALQAVAETARAAAAAELAVVRLVDRGELVARAVAGNAALVAEIEGSRVLDAAPDQEVDEVEQLSPGLRRIAERAGARATLVVPIRVEGQVAALLELHRGGGPFSPTEREAARVAAGQAGLVLRAYSEGTATGLSSSALMLTAEALAAGGDELRGAERIARLAADATGASGCVIWRSGVDGLLVLARSGVADESAVWPFADAVLEARISGLDDLGDSTVASFPVGQPPIGVVQLVFRSSAAPPESSLGTIASFVTRAGQALRALERADELRRELERTRDLLSVVDEATSQLSLAHTLETAVVRLPRLLDVRSVGIYLRQHGRLETAAACEVTGPHSVVAERLLELALGPFRARGFVAAVNAPTDRHLAVVRAAVEEAAIEAVHAVPLVAQGDVIGLLAVYPQAGRALTDDQSALLAALAAQIAVAVQNAGLHEDLKQQEAEQKRAREAEGVAARRLSALYEISRSFAHSLSLEETLDAIATTVVELLEVDVAVIRVPDERGDLLTQRVHVAGPQLEEAMRSVFQKPEHVIPSPARRRLVQGHSVRLNATTAGELGHAHGLLVPFLERGSTAAVVPIATPSELLATLTIVSLDPGRPLTDETLDTALFVAAQAALAVDNARLYQQQKAFMDSMQHSLLPRFRPHVTGLEIGAVYESSALVGVGGDVYDYLKTAETRLAIVLGDVTGHGIDAAADMAMAKFVFRSLARLYPEPAAFLAAANDVVVEEIGSGKFITMLYLTVDAEIGEVACASGGHPPPRLLHEDGAVEGLEAPGMVLGIESGQPYEELRRPLERGDAVVLYTDGVVEARRGGELYGEERLDKLLGDNRELPAQQLADAILADCRRWVGGDLRDDCAVVVVRRL